MLQKLREWTIQGELWVWKVQSPGSLVGAFQYVMTICCLPFDPDKGHYKVSQPRVPQY
jgi:hypothetical protein